MTIKKAIMNIWCKIRPVSCRRCAGLLYTKTERARGISNRCRRIEIEEKARQIKETKQYFFTIPGCSIPSAIFLNMGDLLKSPSYLPGCRIWTGSYDAPVEVELSEVGK